MTRAGRFGLLVAEGSAPGWWSVRQPRRRQWHGRAAAGLRAARYGRTASCQHIRDAIDNGDDQHRKHLLQALIAEIRVESREHITPAYRVPHAQHGDPVRGPETQVDLALHNANRHTAINGPAITVPPLHAKLADTRPSCRNAILDAIDQLRQRTGATEFARRDIVAEIQAAGAGFERQTIYRCLRRMTGHEPGSAHRDLDDLGDDELRIRGD